ncbi:MAG: DedA family protein [Nitrospirota bacterium]|nr:DedA family protein [Nitrospirota bacterium]
MTGEDYSRLGLFFSAFLSSTILPGSSEVVLVGLATQGGLPHWDLLAIATAGNTLGGMTSWGLGWLMALRYPLTELSKVAHRRAVDRVRTWGSPILLLSWVPVLGDPLCVAAGWLRISWLGALLFIGVGKAFRYWVLLALLPSWGS